MPNRITDPRSGRPYCFDCGHALDRKGICWNCYDREHQEPPDVLPEAIEKFKAYRDGRWLVDSWMADGLTEEQAIAEVQDPGFIRLLLFFGRLAQILADQWATEALRQLIIANHRGTIENLEAWIKRLRNPNKGTKRGPKPKGGVPIEHEILRLKRAGKTNGQIAKMLRTTKTNVAAAYNNITNKIARQQQEDRKEAAAAIPRANLPAQ